MSDVVIETHALGKTFVRRVRERGLRRRRDDVIAVADVNLRVHAGETVGFIGANGAGKSTTIKMLTGVLAPTSGSARVLGHVPLPERRVLTRRIGVVFGQRSQLWWDLPVADSFSLLRHVYGVPADRHRRSLEHLVELFSIGPLLGVPVRTLSLGQRMRAEIMAALLHEPELVILDEPTIGLDVMAKQGVRDVLRRLNREQGTTVLLTTHDLADIEHLCERVVIIDHGRLIEDGPLDELVGRAGEDADLEDVVRAIYASRADRP